MEIFTFNILQARRVPSSMWSKIGRLKLSGMPELHSVFGSGSRRGIMSCIAGRLLCDILGDRLKQVFLVFS